MGYPLDLKNPRSFSQRIVWKKIYDRNPLLPIVCDKYRVRQYIKDVLGEEEAEKVLIPLLYASDNPDTIPFDSLSGGYIVKPNHNSGSNIIVEKGVAPDREKIISDLKKQLKSAYGVFKHEWAYKKIKKRMFVIEKLLKDANGGILKDYKFHMIHGKCAFIQVDYDRFSSHSRSLYDSNWNFIKTTLKYKQGPITSRPYELGKMLLLAAKLSKGFDYIRVDLYNIGDRIYFGELTQYPGSGVERFTPQSFDFELGKYWTNKK
ncbi:MAG: hypothetical protein HYT39_02825 [Candidatus Sungbacteria bacterium]|nr:hypothetical protein [Candidatus Sungbacteria bacterium]